MEVTCKVIKKTCPWAKDGQHYIHVTEPICNLQAMMLGAPIECAKIKKCPLTIPEVQAKLPKPKAK